VTTLENIVVVGASLGGLRAVQALRRQGYTGRLTLVGEEPHRPYDRPPLSKEVLRNQEHKVKLDLSPPSFDKLAVELVLGRRAMELDPGNRRVRLDDGRDLPYDGLVIATGAYPRALPGQPDLDGVFMLRTIDDARALQAALVAAENVVVIGAGFIGAEVAASCRELGKKVTMLEAAPVPVARALGLTIGEALAALHRSRGVEVRCGVGVHAIEGDGERVREVVLDDGTRLRADVVVVGIGVVPAIDWLRPHPSVAERTQSLPCSARYCHNGDKLT
jgi:NADPH-dependent 2,4-dienoyl-CoA reductase/sulfur reductase-like enzyme